MHYTEVWKISRKIFLNVDAHIKDRRSQLPPVPPKEKKDEKKCKVLDENHNRVSKVIQLNKSKPVMESKNSKKLKPERRNVTPKKRLGVLDNKRFRRNLSRRQQNLV